MLTLAEEIRAEFAKIKLRYEGLPEAIASIRLSTVEKIEQYMDHVHDTSGVCRACEEPRNQFEISEKDDGKHFARFGKRIANALDDEKRIAAESGMMTRAALDEARLAGAGGVS